MSAKPLELFTASTARSKSPDVRSVLLAERRRRARTQVHWPVLFLCSNGLDAIESITENLSSDGFYCLSPVAFTLGEILSCTLNMPTHDPAGKQLVRALGCKVKVVRIEPGARDGLFGIAYQIQDYHFAAGSGK